MSLPFYLTFVAACCILTFGINGQTGAANSPSPQNFLSLNICPYTPTINCPSTPKFRLIDGSCNLANSPYYGKSETPYIRLVPPMYINKKIPRNVSFFGSPLPGPRKISIDLFKETPAESTTFTTIGSTFARFVEHDLYKTKLSSAISCCTPTEGAGVCDNIKVSTTDPFYKAYLKTCLPKGNFVSSTKLDCKTDGSPEQINENTHLLDLSNIYGSTTADSDRLRTKTDGLLKVSDDKKFLPKYEFSDCIIPTPNPKGEHCFDAGDRRVNIDPLIMTMYTVWVLHHNAIATKLKYILKDANDETIFQTARKIVIAQYQHIVYNELLPALDTSTTPITSPTSYSANEKPSIYNVFSLVYTAIVDSMIPTKVAIDGTDVEMDSFYYTPAKLFETGITKILEGMKGSKAEKIDRFVVKALTDKYLKKAPGSGTDKVALNLQQSRENGAPCYPVLYSVLNQKYDGALPKIDTAITELNTLYPKKFDIELLPGLFSETKAPTEMYGPTIKNLMDKQFKLLKDSDPFFYSHTGVFTTKRFDEIKKTTLAKILCTNGPVAKVPKYALKIIETTNNPDTDCNTIKDIGICTWSTVEWSEWVSLGCYFGVSVLTRQCNILAGSECSCDGDPIKYASCPSGLFQNIVDVETVQQINATFYQYFGHDGKPLNRTSGLNIINILNGVTP